MPKVVVAEKPSVARDLARVLGARTRREHWIERGDGLRVTWTLGHLVELKYPDDYRPELKRWRLETLPFVPETFELRPTGDASARAQLEAVVAVCGEADELVCATDAGREGELIFRYVLQYGGLQDKAFRRLWLSSMTDAEIKKAFAAMRDGSEYERLYQAARCRSEADWIVGINATRYHTVRFAGGRVLWSVGRVQTPVLALIAQREDEIRTFVPRPFWELRTKCRGVLFRRAAKDAESARFDDEASAQQALDRVTGVPLEVVKVERKRETTPAPFLHDLTSLQRSMNGRYGMSAARTLKVAQELYEKKFITYPRTDARHLPASMAAQIPGILRALHDVDPEAVGHLPLDDLPRSKRVFDDQKVTDHHAIVPTGTVPRGLDEDGQRVYRAVLRRLCQVFMKDRVRDVTTVHARAADEAFRARGVHEVEPGWSALDPAPAKRKAAPGRKSAGKQGDDEEDQQLPEFAEGESGPHEPQLHQGETKAPRPWTESSLLGAMETAGRFVDDEELREALKARGIGTPATRASILETLLSRGYVVRDKKTLRCTDLGRFLVAIVRDPLLLSPELTGEWEARLREIETGARDPDEFIAGIVHWTRGLCRPGTDEPGATPGDDDPTLGPCPRCGAAVIEGREGYGCSAWREGCGFVLWKGYRGATLSRSAARQLLRQQVLTTPVRLDEVGPRMLCMTAQGLLIDLEVPSRDRQQGGGKREPTRRGPKSGGRPEPGAAAPRRRASAGASEGTSPAAGLPDCPRCGAPLIEGQRGYGCSAWRSAGCRFVVWKRIQGRRVTVANVRTLVAKGKTRAMQGFAADDGTAFKARLVLGSDGVAVEPVD